MYGGNGPQDYISKNLLTILPLPFYSGSSAKFKFSKIYSSLSRGSLKSIKDLVLEEPRLLKNLDYLVGLVSVIVSMSYGISG